MLKSVPVDLVGGSGEAIRSQQSCTRDMQLSSNTGNALSEYPGPLDGE